MSVVFDAGKVQNIFKVLDEPPELKSTAESELELDIGVLEESVSGVASVIVPVPTSQLAVPSS